MIDLPIPPSFKLTGKRALVTGATSGIGLGCAVALADAGADVTVAARNQQNLDDVVMAFQEKGWSVSSVSLDISKTEDVRQFIEKKAPFDILVNSAGLARHTSALETTTADFDEVSGLNIKGAYFLTRDIARTLIQAGRPGSLINISSQMAKVGGVDRAVYCATKHAVEGFTKAMAMEFGPYKIRVNTICPTFIRTPLTAGTFENSERVKWIKEKIKLGRVGEVEDVMGAVVYLASDASSLVTGTSLLVDGGWVAG